MTRLPVVSLSHGRNLRLFPGSLLGTGLLLALCWSPGGAEAGLGRGQDDQVTFRFAPPDGTRARVVTQVSQSIVLDDVEQPPEVREWRHLLEFRTTAGGVTIRHTPELAPTSDWAADSQSVQGLAEALLGSGDLTFYFDRTGGFLRASGLNQALEDIEDALPREAEVTLAKLGPFAAQQLQQQWRDRFAPFVGQSFPVGKFARTEQDAEMLPGVSIGGTSEWGVVERVEYEGRNLVVLMTGWTSEDPRLTEVFGTFFVDSITELLDSIDHPNVPAAKQALAAANPRISIERFLFSNERLIDPATMLTYTERFRRAFRGSVSAEGSSSDVIYLQENELVYEYLR